MNAYIKGTAGPAQSLSTDNLPTLPFALLFSMLSEVSINF